jgi:hypothetical protein
VAKYVARGRYMAMEGEPIRYVARGEVNRYMAGGEVHSQGFSVSARGHVTLG